MDIGQAIEEWRKVVAQRKALDAMSKQIKEGVEAKLKAQILMYLDANNLNGVRSSDGFVSRTEKTHLEITDQEKFLSEQHALLMKSVHDSIPFGDNLILQRTPHKGFITELVRKRLGLSENEDLSDEKFNSISEQFGIRRVSEADLSFKSK